MLDLFNKMLNGAEMISHYSMVEDTIVYDGDEISVYAVIIPTDEIGNAVKAIFHKGTEELIDFQIVHVCTCGGHCHHDE